MDQEKLCQEITHIVAEISEEDPQTIEPDNNLPERHNVNSLMGLEILVALEKQYKIKIPESRLQDMITVQKIADIVAEELHAKVSA